MHNFNYDVITVNDV